MQAQAEQIVAEDQRGAGVAIEERLDAQVIPCTEEHAPGLVPDGERKIAEQMIDRALAPDRIGTENQLWIWSLDTRRAAVRGELADQFLAGIDATVRGNPCRAVERQGLALGFGLPRRPKQGVAKSHVLVGPDFLSIGSARGEMPDHLREQGPLDWRPIEVHDADDSAHIVSVGYREKLLPTLPEPSAPERARLSVI